MMWLQPEAIFQILTCRPYHAAVGLGKARARAGFWMWIFICHFLLIPWQEPHPVWVLSPVEWPGNTFNLNLSCLVAMMPPGYILMENLLFWPLITYVTLYKLIILHCWDCSFPKLELFCNGLHTGSGQCRAIMVIKGSVSVLGAHRGVCVSTISGTAVFLLRSVDCPCRKSAEVH